MSNIYIKPLAPWNPLSHLLMLKWVFLEPERLQTYRKRHGDGAVKEVGAWLASVLLWLPLFIPLLGMGVGTLPTIERPVSVWLIVAGVIVGWLLTVAMARRERDRVGGKWRDAFGPVFSTGFLFALGLSVGVGFGMGLTTALDMNDIIDVGSVFGSLGVVVFVVAFGVAFGIAIIVADNVAFAGAFIITPVLAFLVSGQVAFGIGFVGAFLSIFLLTFAMTFAGGFAANLVLSSVLSRSIERKPDSGVVTVLRIAGLAAMVISFAVLVWMCLLGGWRVMA